MRAKQDELSKARVVAEAEITLQGYQQLDIETVCSYVEDLWNILEESEVAPRKAFLRPFVKNIVVEKEGLKVHYNLPIPTDGKMRELLGVLPIGTPGGPNITFAKPIETFFELSIGSAPPHLGSRTMSLNDHSPFYPNRSTRAKAYLEANEVDRLQKAATNLRDRLLIRLLSHLGCRISEALGIKVEDIDLVNHTVTIQHLKTRIQLSCPHCSARLGRSHTYCPRCGAKVEKAIAEEKEHRRLRTLPIDGETIGMLKELHFAWRSGVTKEARQLIFGINRHRAWQIVKECAEKAGLPKLVNPETGRIHNVSPHRLRDAFAVHAVKLDDSGDGLRLLQEHLGHQSFNTTAKYRKVSGKEHQEWYQKLWEKKD